MLQDFGPVHLLLPVATLQTAVPQSASTPVAEGTGRQLSRSLQIKSMSDPSWASCPRGSGGVRGREGGGTSGELDKDPPLCCGYSCPVLLCLCARGRVSEHRLMELRRESPICAQPHGSVPSAFMCNLTKLGGALKYMSADAETGSAPGGRHPERIGGGGKWGGTCHPRL